MKPKSASRPNKHPANAVPQSIEACERLLTQLHQHRATLQAGYDAHDTHVTLLRERLTTQAAPIEAEIARLSGLIQSFCEARRKDLTDDGRAKTVRFKTGTVSWRKGRTRVMIDGDEADILVTLKAMRLKKFIREVEEIDKAEMLRSPAQAKTVPGVTLADGVETFSIEAQESTS